MPKPLQRPARPSKVSPTFFFFLYHYFPSSSLQSSHLSLLCCSSIMHDHLLFQALLTCFSFFLECFYSGLFQFASSSLSHLCSYKSSHIGLPLLFYKIATHLVFTHKHSSISLSCFPFLQNMHHLPTYYLMYLLSYLWPSMRI